MSQPKHSPGPLEYRPAYTKGEPSGFVIRNEYANLADVLNNVEIEEAEANAVLFTASHDLLDSLQKLVDLCKGFCHLRKEEITDYPEIPEAIAAIAKAKGGA